MQDTKVFKILSYIGPLFLISLFIEQKNDPDVKLHCGQGMLLFVTEFVLGLILGIVAIILNIIPFIGLLISSLLASAVSLIFFVFAIIGIINAATDKDVPLPVIGGLAFYK